MDRLWDMDFEDHKPLQDMTIQMFGKKYKLQPAADLELHPTTVGEELQRQPSLYAFYATVHSMAVAKVSAIGRKLENRRSELDTEWRQQGFLPGEIKITEDALRRALRNDETITRIQTAMNDAEFDAMCLANIVRAFEHKRDCLIELSKRTNNTTFNDQDVNVTVSARITLIDAVRNTGQHPSKQK